MAALCKYAATAKLTEFVPRRFVSQVDNLRERNMVLLAASHVTSGLNNTPSTSDTSGFANGASDKMKSDQGEAIVLDVPFSEFAPKQMFLKAAFSKGMELLLNLTAGSIEVTDFQKSRVGTTKVLHTRNFLPFSTLTPPITDFLSPDYFQHHSSL
jgi:hypothetical protein